MGADDLAGEGGGIGAGAGVGGGGDAEPVSDDVGDGTLLAA